MGGAGLGDLLETKRGRDVGRVVVFAGICRVFSSDANLRSDFRRAPSLAAFNWRILFYYLANPGQLQLATFKQGWVGTLCLHWVARK